MGSIFSFCFSCCWKVQIAIKKTATNHYITLRLADEGHITVHKANRVSSATTPIHPLPYLTSGDRLSKFSE